MPGKMAIKQLAAAASLILAVRAAPQAPVNECLDGECVNEESSLMAFRPPQGFMNMTKWFAGWGVSMCRNKYGVEFCCGDGECCGNVCKAKGDLCCRNDLGDTFPCQAGGECCGNACAAPGSKCCNKGKPGYEYPVSEGTACTGDSIECINSHGNAFQCGAGSSCCGDICVAPGGVCCKSSGHSFVCGPNSKCCGNSCQAPGSKCCHTKGLDYPVTKDTKCVGWNSGSVVCQNRYGAEFQCGAKSSCCGDICAGEGSTCCQNVEGTDFVCAPGSRCGKNVCLARR